MHFRIKDDHGDDDHDDVIAGDEREIWRFLQAAAAALIPHQIYSSLSIIVMMIVHLVRSLVLCSLFRILFSFPASSLLALFLSSGGNIHISFTFSFPSGNKPFLPSSIHSSISIRSSRLFFRYSVVPSSTEIILLFLPQLPSSLHFICSSHPNSSSN